MEIIPYVTIQTHISLSGVFVTFMYNNEQKWRYCF